MLAYRDSKEHADILLNISRNICKTSKLFLDILLPSYKTLHQLLYMQFSKFNLPVSKLAHTFLAMILESYEIFNTFPWCSSFRKILPNSGDQYVLRRPLFCYHVDAGERYSNENNQMHVQIP